MVNLGRPYICRMQEIEILLTDSLNAGFQKLAKELEKEVSGLSRPLSDRNYKPGKTEKNSNVLVGYQNDLAIACVVFRQYNASSVEIKQLYVLPDCRRKKVASQILSALEMLAKEMKFKNCVLETGKNQPGAISFFSKNGYKQTDNFGIYVNNVNSICFSKRI